MKKRSEGLRFLVLRVKPEGETRKPRPQNQQVQSVKYTRAFGFRERLPSHLSHSKIRVPYPL